MGRNFGKTIASLQASLCAVHHTPMARTTSQGIGGRPGYTFLSCPACNADALDRMAKQPGAITIEVGEMSMADALTRDQEDSARERDAWSGDYDGTTCPNCSRLRMLKCTNGKRRCEKCNWDPDAGKYSEGPYIG